MKQRTSRNGWLSIQSAQNTQQTLATRWKMIKKFLIKRHFSPNHSDFDFNRYPWSILFDFKSFLGVFKRGTVDVLNLKKRKKNMKKNKKKCTGGALILFLIFQTSTHLQFYVWTHSKTSLNQRGSRVKPESMWLGGKKVAWWGGGGGVAVFYHFQRPKELTLGPVIGSSETPYSVVKSNEFFK